MATAASAVYQQRVGQELCAQGCGAPPADGHELCVGHRDAKRERQRLWIKRRRKQRRRAKQCGDCGRPLQRGERIWCKAHRITRNRLSGLAGAGVDNNVDTRDARIAAATNKDPDGRTRYRGQQKRGQQPKSQLNVQDLRHATENWEGFSAGVALMASPEAETWSRGERERVEVATASLGERATRRVDDILERLGHFKQRHGRRDE